MFEMTLHDSLHDEALNWHKELVEAGLALTDIGMS